MRSLSARYSAGLSATIVLLLLGGLAVVPFRAGLAAELYLGNKGIGDQLKYADRRRSLVAPLPCAAPVAAAAVPVASASESLSEAPPSSPSLRWWPSGARMKLKF